MTWVDAIGAARESLGTGRGPGGVSAADAFEKIDGDDTARAVAQIDDLVAQRCSLIDKVGSTYRSSGVDGSAGLSLSA